MDYIVIIGIPAAYVVALILFSVNQHKLPSRLSKLMTWLFVGLPVVAFLSMIIILLSTPIPDEEPMTSIDYRTAADLEHVTGVEFPEVVPVDSVVHNYNFHEFHYTISYKPKKPLTREFFNKLNKTCKQRPCCWSVENEGYWFSFVSPRETEDEDDVNSDSLHVKGEHRCQIVRDDGRWEDASKSRGMSISVFVPYSGDTIRLHQSFW